MKKLMKRTIALALCLSASIIPLAACGDNSSAGAGEGQITIGFTNMADTDVFCKYTMDRFVEQAKQKGWAVNTADAELDTLKQIQQVNNFIASDVDAIVIEAVDYEAIVPGIEAANEANIPVICLICDAAAATLCILVRTTTSAAKPRPNFTVRNCRKMQRLFTWQELQALTIPRCAMTASLKTLSGMT